MRGIITSSSTTLGLSRRTAARPSRPSAAVATSTPSASRMKATVSRMFASSSTRTTQSRRCELRKRVVVVTGGSLLFHPRGRPFLEKRRHAFDGLVADAQAGDEIGRVVERCFAVEPVDGEDEFLGGNEGLRACLGEIGEHAAEGRVQLVVGGHDVDEAV